MSTQQTDNDNYPVLPVGKADIVGFGQEHTFLLVNGTTALQSVLDDFCYTKNWRVDKHLRYVADATGDGTGDLIGFGDAGVMIAANKGDNTFQPIQTVVQDFGYIPGNWRISKHPRFLADLCKTGRVDIIGFGDSGVVVSRNNGNLKFGTPYVALKDFGYNAGNWRADRHLRLLGDINGNGYPDIIGFGETGVYVSFNKLDGTFSAPIKLVLSNMCISAGAWTIQEYPRFVADMNGNKCVDLVGFGEAGLYVAFNDGTGNKFSDINLRIPDFGHGQGWLVEKHPRFVADLTGDGRGDIIGFHDEGVYIALNNGDGSFQPKTLAITDNFGANQGWVVGQHPRFVVDLTGDGLADIVGFFTDHVEVAYNQGGGKFSEVSLIQNFGSAQGWMPSQHIRCPANVNHGSTAAVVQPASMQFASVQSASVQSASVQPASVQPASVQPAVVQSASVQPASVQPASVQPAVVQPAKS